ncbi:hypothetical protein ACFCXH_10580 [Streptomyces nojiriensis]|uniref:hypothetical protein n=1 Tax=Streptomyces nojiriensis TaxID=66374 RepID=UPI0035DC3701
MQFKRMAVVAAAAMAGQTLLIAAPAVAEEHPAVTAPDAVPADAAGPTEAAEQEQAGEKEQAEGTGPQQPAAQAVAAPETPESPESPETPTVPAAAEAQPPTQTQVQAQALPEAVEDEQGTGSDRILVGPEVTVAGIPKDGFKADGSWTPLTVTVDNSGHVAVADYTPKLGVSQAAGQLGPAHVKVEYRSAGGPWTAAAPVPTAAPTLGYALGSAGPVPVGQVRTIDVRISFAADTPVVPFDLTADGTGRVGATTGSSPTSLYSTRIAGAPGGDEDPLFTEGPALTVSGVPESVRAGGDWTDLSVRVDNVGKGELAAFYLGLVLARPDFVSMQVSQISVEVLRPAADGQPAAWQAVEITSDEDGYFLAGGLVRGPIGAGAAFDVPVRVRFSADAPTGSVSFFAWGTSQVDAETPPPWAGSRSKRQLTTLLQPATTPGGEAPGGGTPGAETPGGETPGGSTPGGATPGGGTPEGGTPAETPGGGTPGGDSPGSATPGAGTPGSGTPGGGTPGAETPGGGASGGETPGGEAPDGSTPGAGTPGAETPGSGTPEGGAPGGSTPGGGTPGGSTPGGGTPGAETPGGSTPGGNSPGSATPGGGNPGGETPGGGTPGGDSPGSGTPGGGSPGGETLGGGTPGGAPGGNVPEPNGGTVTVPTGVSATALAATGADLATGWALGGAGTALALGAALVAGTGRHRRRRTN